MRILVVGASGYIGGRLVPRLAARGHELVLMSRDARPVGARFPQATVVLADLLDPSTLPLALERVEVAYYLAHSMERVNGGSPSATGRQPATSPRRRSVPACRGRYLGGLGDDSANLSTTSRAATRPAPSRRT